MFATCPSCPGFVPSNADACPHCGAGVDRQQPSALAGLAGTVAKLAATGAVMVTLMACYGAPNDDGPFFQCFDDTECGEGAVCDDFGSCVSGERCGNGFDDDNDGLADLDDPDCSELAFETRCDDGLDDDADGLVDCADFDCDGAASCLEICDNGLDDDADGFVDCNDTDSCSVCPTTEIECGNLFDDDQDGFTDCDDPDCEALCTPPVCGDGLVGSAEQCDDGNVVGLDGCSAECTVEFDVFCAAVPVLVLGENAGSNDGGSTNVMGASCVASGGQETVYSFTAAADGTLFLALQADHDMGLSVSGHCDPSTNPPPPDGELACANAVGAGQLESASVELLAGQIVFVVADGAQASSGGPFVMTATYVDAGK